MTGLGYDLVDADKSAGGLLRVLIDNLPRQRDNLPKQGDNLPPSEVFITVDDCEKVTRQLQHVLEVEGCAYERLEVSSPGLDRPLKKAADYVRFAGQQIEITLKMPFKGRKKFSGELQALGDGWRLVLDAPRPTRGVKRAAAALSAADTAGAEGAPSAQALDFSLDEVREAFLVPVVDFKGLRFAAPDAAASAGLPDEKQDGGRIQ